MTGFSIADVAGRRHFELKSPQHDTQFDDALWQEVRSIGLWRGEFWHRHRSQADFPVRATVTAVTDQAGVVTHYVFTLVDITDQRQREEQRRRDELMQRDALVREVHHRIKNNLQGIAGLLRQFEYSQPETHEAITQAIGHVQSIALIHGLQGQEASEQVRIEPMVRAIVQSLQALWQGSIELRIPADWSTWVLAENEAVPIALILNELVVNAIKHGDSPERRVEVTVSQDSESESIQFLIANGGQLANPHPTQDPSIHMGLSLVASLMPRRGGRFTQVQVDQRVITTLTLTHPVIEKAVEPVAHAAENSKT